MNVSVYALMGILMSVTLVCCLSVQCLEEDTALSDQHQRAGSSAQSSAPFPVDENAKR